MRVLTSLILTFFLLNVHSQQTEEPFSENGWYLNPHGTIRILVLFAEIEYDLVPSRDPQPDGADHWRKGELPEWKDNLFDPYPLSTPRAMVSKYYHDISLGQYTVLGDYIPTLLTLKESEHRNLYNLSAAAVNEANKLSGFRTANGLAISDFDLWKDNGKPGKTKELGADDPHRYDHTMVIVRNSNRLTHGQGSTDAGTPGKLFGYESDTQSRFGAMNALPFEILKHEYNHMLLGGNNFHSGGGNAPQFEAFFTCQQGGWSLMGSANSSLLGATGWDRYRLGWKKTESPYLISAKNGAGKTVSGDLDPLNGDTGIYMIDDFVTRGDVLRIRIPYLPDDEYQQWLWIEYHLSEKLNGVHTDNFHWSHANSCAPQAIPGLYMMMQVDREKKLGGDIYRGPADYLRPVLANGNADLEMTDEFIEKACPFNGRGPIFDRNRSSENPLSGNHEQELPLYDKNNDGVLDRREHFIPSVRRVDGVVDGQVIFFGRPEHVFTLKGNNKIGMGTNPSTANMTTLVRSGNRYTGQPFEAPNNRCIYLNGISVEILSQEGADQIKLRVRANDTYVGNDIRWAADSIVLPYIRGYQNHSLHLGKRKTITVNRSGTPSRNHDPEEYDSTLLWNDATSFTVDSMASVYLDEGSSLTLKEGSTLYLRKGATLEIAKGAELRICKDCALIAEPGSMVILHKRSKVNNRGTFKDGGMELYQYCRGTLTTQGDKSPFEGSQ